MDAMLASPMLLPAPATHHTVPATRLTRDARCFDSCPRQPVEYAWGVVSHLMGVKNSDELRAVHGEMQSAVIQTTTKLSQSAAVYKALEAVAANADGLDDAQRRIVESSLASMKLSGVGLEGEAKEAFNANRMKLAELSTTFSNNLLDATKAYSLMLTDPAQVAGLPQSALSLAASRAVEAGEEGARSRRSTS